MGGEETGSATPDPVAPPAFVASPSGGAPEGSAWPRRHRFATAIVGLLLAASLVCVGLVVARMAYSHTVHYWFLMWNLALAWVPFVFAGLAYTLASSRRALTYVLIVCAALVWLLFFPNAPYILTDFLHPGANLPDAVAWINSMLFTFKLSIYFLFIRKGPLK